MYSHRESVSVSVLLVLYDWRHAVLTSGIMEHTFSISSWVIHRVQGQRHLVFVDEAFAFCV